MKTRGVMTMNDERVVLTGEYFRSRFGSLIERSSASVVRQRVVVLDWSRLRRWLPRFRLLSVKLGRISADRLPRIAFFQQNVRGVSQVELVWVSNRLKSVPR